MALDYGILSEAAQSNKTIMLEYSSPRTGKYTAGREVEPYEMKNGFLFAFDIAEGSIKKFSESGILSIEMTENTFFPRWPVQIY